MTALHQVSAAAALALAVSACHSTVSGGPVRDDGMGLPYPTTSRPELAPANRTTQPTSGSRQVCRGQRMPPGWIAVNYVEAEKECPPQSSASEQYTGAVTVRYDGMVEGTELLVCADQGVPRGWMRRSLPDSTMVGDRCPTSRGSIPAEKRVKLIQRRR